MKLLRVNSHLAPEAEMNLNCPDGRQFICFLVLAGKKTISILASNHFRIRELEKNVGQPFCFTVCTQSVSVLLVCQNSSNQNFRLQLSMD